MANLYGTSGADTIDGSSSSDVITAYGGDDLIRAADTEPYIDAGNDTIYGGTGNDDIYVGAGAKNQVYGEAGDDFIYVEYYGKGNFYGGSGDDWLSFLYTEGFVVDGGSGDDTFYVTTTDFKITDSSGTDTIYSEASTLTLPTGIEIGRLINTADGASEPNPKGALTGNSSNNTLYGGGYLDTTLKGLGGNDTLYGSTGNDFLIGGTGTDRFYGGTGSDTVDYADHATAVKVDLAAGKVTFPGKSWTAETLSSIENAATGDSNDTLIGNSGANDLRGRGGNDWLSGGAGADRLGGGKGFDTFVFKAGDSTTSATDILRAVDAGKAFDNPGSAKGDLIDLRAIDAVAGGGDTAFKWGGTTKKTTGYLWLGTEGSDTVVWGNTDSDSAAELKIKIADGSVGHTAYSAADFLL